jgi:hypothetical protein
MQLTVGPVVPSNFHLLVFPLLRFHLVQSTKSKEVTPLVKTIPSSFAMMALPPPPLAVEVISTVSFAPSLKVVTVILVPATILSSK